jgi:hypothetical protein
LQGHLRDRRDAAISVRIGRADRLPHHPGSDERLGAPRHASSSDREEVIGTRFRV